MSYGAIGGYGFGLDDLSCPPGEQFDFTSMQCVTAGQAITPVPPLPSAPPPLPPLPSPPPPPAPPPPASMADQLRQYAPWLLGGAVVLGAVVILSRGGTRATPNARVPKHKHKCVCAVQNGKRSNIQRLATAITVDQIQKYINEYYYSNNYRVDPITLEITNTQRSVPPGIFVERYRGGYLFGRRSVPNKRRQRSSKRPPKKWFRDCVREVSASGSAIDPQSVCGATWYRKMGPKQRKAAKRRHYGRAA